jgi:hypothetical protein
MSDHDAVRGAGEMFVGGLDCVSRMTQQITRLRDIARRVTDDRQQTTEASPEGLELAGLADSKV